MRTNRLVMLVIVLVTIAFPLLTARAGEEPHPFSVHDMLAMDRVSDPQVSPCGKWVAFVVRVTDLEADKGRTDIWLAETGGTNLRQLTANPAGDWNPRWTPCGKIAFLSTRSGSSQIWMIDPTGGEARQMTKLPLDVGNLEVVAKLESFIFSMEVYPGTTVEETVQRDKEKAEGKTSGMIYNELMFRHWDTLEDGKRSHLFIRPAGGSDADTRDLMPGLDADVPTRPWGGSEEFAVSADGKELYFTAKVLPGSEPAWSTDYDIYAVPTAAVDGAVAMRCLTEDNQAWDTAPLVSPDGKTLAWTAMARPGFEADRFRIWLMDLESGAQRTLTGDWDRSPGGLLWSEDGKTIFCTAYNLGQKSLFAVDAKSGAAKEVVKMGRSGSLQLLGDNRVLYTLQTLRSPNELWTVGRDGADPKQLTDFNGPKLALAKMGEAEQFTFKGWNNEEVWAYVVKPFDFDPNKKYPVAFLIHGGPQGSFGNSFHYRWNPQAYVGAGFCAVMVDFHGSVGYGQDFTDAISGHWGDRPYEDLVKGLGAALERYPWMDGERVVAAGASFGGYMINWIHGQPFADSFRAFVCHDGNIDERMAYYDTEELWFPEWENGGAPFTAPEHYGQFNPIDHIANWKVPTLVVHGALDYRVVDTQGLSAFTALRRQGVPARLLYYPDENHWVLSPNNSIQWHNEVMAWITRWTEAAQ